MKEEEEGASLRKQFISHRPCHVYKTNRDTLLVITNPGLLPL